MKNWKISKVENKISNVYNFVTKADCKSKETEFKDKIPNIDNLATKSEILEVEKKFSSVGNLFKNSKITELKKIINETKHDQYITTLEFNKFLANCCCKNKTNNISR